MSDEEIHTYMTIKKYCYTAGVYPATVLQCAHSLASSWSHECDDIIKLFSAKCHEQATL